jgi:crotonobetainyl-CoA:carnitine CoA-transferase CaiB-like acyl-CoA transferase
MGGALEGWRILELADDVPAMFCSKILSDLGADVVKVTPPVRSVPAIRTLGTTRRAHASSTSTPARRVSWSVPTTRHP